jgi:uncharacterized delta-60 repeat protein
VGRSRVRQDRGMRRIALLTALLFCLVSAAPAGAATPDHRFGDGGIALTGFGTHLDLRRHTAAQVEVEPSGRIVLGVSGSRGTFTVERVTAAGALDPSFGADGMVPTAIDGQAMTVAPDGGIVVVGSTGEGDPGRDIAVTRYLSSGKVDRSFGRGGTFRLDAGLEDFAEAVALQADGTIVVVGHSLCPARAPGCGYYGRSKLVLLRLSAKGRLLSHTELKATQSQVGMAIAGDGRILVVTGSDGRARPALLIDFTAGGRLLAGSVKGSSTPLVGAPEAATFTLGANGESLIAGYTTARGNYLSRLLPDGSADPSFGGGSIICKPTRTEYFNGANPRIAAFPGGDVLISGGSGNCSLARYLPVGSLDPSFGEGGLVEADAPLGGPVEDLAAGPGETAVALRWQVGAGFRLARYTANGALDPSFGQAGVATVPTTASTFDQVNALLPLPKGKLLAVGTSQCADHSCGEFALARYLPGGRLDPSFGHRGRVTTPVAGEGLATSAATRRDGGIVVAGAVGTRAYSELHNTDPTLAAYKRGGGLDRGFGKDGIVSVPSAKGEDAQFNGVAIAPDGDIVAVGESSCTQEETCGKRYCSECGAYVVARFHPDGSRDRAFGKDGVLHIDVGHNDEDHDAARAVAIGPDGKILVAGRTWLGGFGLVRLLPDGRRDTSFGRRGIVRTYFAVTLRDSDGKPFDLEVGRPAYALALLPGGGILVSGGAEVPRGPGTRHPMNHGVVARYRPDGRRDTSFGKDGLTDVPGLAVRAMSVDRCGRPVVAGPYSVDSKVSSFGAARLLPSGALDRSFGRPTVHLALGTGVESRANAVAISGGDVVLGGVASNDGSGDDFALAALKGGGDCRR